MKNQMKKTTRTAEIISFLLDAIAFLVLVWVFLSACTFAGRGDIIFVPEWNFFRYLLPLLHAMGA